MVTYQNESTMRDNERKMSDIAISLAPCRGKCEGALTTASGLHAVECHVTKVFMVEAEHVLIRFHWRRSCFEPLSVTAVFTADRLITRTHNAQLSIT